MRLIKLTFFLFLIDMCTNIFALGSEKCEDCKLLAQCNDAMDVATKYGSSSRTKNIFAKAHCGEIHKRGRTLNLFCCSDFEFIRDPILSHPNIELLAASCPNLDQKRIYGGSVAGIYEFPWMALILCHTSNGIQSVCGGSILNSRYILTAAHCVHNQKVAGVRVGEHTINNVKDCEGDPPNVTCETHLQDVVVEDIIIHEGYTMFPVKNDIALIRVAQTLDFTHENVAPVCLPLIEKFRTPITDGAKGIVAGWGLTEKLQSSQILLKVEIPVLSNVTCENLFYHKKNIVGLEFCAGELNKDSCSGDSGGPFVMERTHNNVCSYYQYGIVSRGPRQCGIGYPGIYTNVIEYLEWILNNIRE